MKRAAIYLRVSTSAQAKRNREPEGYSIPAQREACQRKASTIDAEIVAEYVDAGESARQQTDPNCAHCWTASSSSETSTT